MLCNIKPVPFHESDKHIFAKIPGGVGTPGPRSGSAHVILMSVQHIKFDIRVISPLPHRYSSTVDSFRKHCGKKEIARNEQFLLFPQCFLLNQKIISLFINIYDIISLFAAELEEPKIGM